MRPLVPATDLIPAPATHPTTPAVPTALVAADVLRGTSRLLHDLGHVVLPEFGLACGRRADVMALGPDGCFAIVEIKSCRQDFLTDRKWPDYLGYADRFYFAVTPGFPEEILPEEEGLILADRFEGALVRPARERALAPARRKTLLLSFARTAASRLRYLTDSGPELGAI